MDRRTFVALLPLGAASVVKSQAEPIDRGRPGGIRVSSVKGDPGERLYSELCGDRKRIRVLLDGVEQKNTVTADERLGLVKRAVTTERGNIAINQATDEIFYEEVYGLVQILIA